MMNKQERFKTIIELLQLHHKVEVNELAEMLKTSSMTIRRDLNELAKEYNITRTHGGAILDSDIPVRVVSFDDERITHRAEKEVIARYAATMVRSGQRFYLDSGSNTRILLNYLDPDIKAVVVCNNLDVAKKALEFPNLSVIMLGGDMIRLSNCTSGPIAEAQIQSYSLDLAFIGAAAIGSDGHLFDGFSPEARVKNYIFDVASKVFLLADSSKMNTYDMTQYGHLENVNAVITDSGIDKHGESLIKRYGVELIKV